MIMCATGALPGSLPWTWRRGKSLGHAIAGIEPRNSASFCRPWRPMCRTGVHLILDNYGAHHTLAIRSALSHALHAHQCLLADSREALVRALLTEKRIRRGMSLSTRALEMAIQEFSISTIQSPSRSYGRKARTRSSRVSPTFVNELLRNRPAQGVHHET